MISALISAPSCLVMSLLVKSSPYSRKASSKLSAIARALGGSICAASKIERIFVVLTPQSISVRRCCCKSGWTSRAPLEKQTGSQASLPLPGSVGLIFFRRLRLRDDVCPRAIFAKPPAVGPKPSSVICLRAGALGYLADSAAFIRENLPRAIWSLKRPICRGLSPASPPVSVGRWGDLSPAAPPVRQASISVGR